MFICSGFRRKKSTNLLFRMKVQFEYINWADRVVVRTYVYLLFFSLNKKRCLLMLCLTYPIISRVNRSVLVFWSSTKVFNFPNWAINNCIKLQNLSEHIFVIISRIKGESVHSPGAIKQIPNFSILFLVWILVH